MIFARVAAAFAAGVFFCLALPLGAAADAVTDEAATAAYLESIHNVPDRLDAFFAALPKGADLHNHASGAVYAEDYLAWAQRDGGCYDAKTYALASTCAAGQRRIADGVAAEPNFGKNVIDALSMANFVPTTPTAGHDHFFNTFGLFGDVAYTHRTGVVAAATSDAARQHVDVLELMVSAASDESGALAKRFGTGGNPAFSETDFAADSAVIERGGGFAAAVAAGKKQLADLEAGRRALMRCGTPAADPGCAVDLHYILQVTRVADAPHVFVQTRVGLAIASDPRSRAVGINYVAPEDNPRAVSDYALHMRMVRDLHARYPNARVTLHAGELTPLLVKPDALRDHVRTAVEVAGAARIGHGVDVLGEDNAQQLLGVMAARRTLVEIALTSNDVILNVRGAAHPLPTYLERGVPVALVTDDPGVSRSNLSREFLRAETTYAFPYATLKRMVRNSVEYAFLAGGSLWADPSYAHRVPACESAAPIEGPPAVAACAAYLDANPRARAEHKLETELRAFESSTARGTGRAAS
jgi:adenosine deaminase